jgi:lipoprotein-releasing system permease protein
MFTPLSMCIGLRYTRARRRTHFISFITLTSILGIALGVTALITVLSVMNGFEKELRARILGMASHATITGVDLTLERWSERAKVAKAHPRVVGVAPYVNGEGMLTNGGFVRGMLLRGIDPTLEPQVAEVVQYMKQGTLSDLRPGEFKIILGSALARAVGARLGSKVTVVTPQARITPAGVLPRLRRFTVVGIFEVGHGQYDSSLALINIDDAAKLLRLGDRVTGVRLKVDDMDAAPLIAKQLALQFDGRFFVRDWTQIQGNFFKALATEKTVMFVILTLIVAVAAFNIVATLIMVVTDKQSDIAILRTLGVTPRQVMAIFMVQGTVIGTFGALSGAAGGVALALNVETIVSTIEKVLNVTFLNPTIYYISKVPSDLRWADVQAITIVAFVLSVLATLYPAWRASRTQPAQALRYD